MSFNCEEQRSEYYRNYSYTLTGLKSKAQRQILYETYLFRLLDRHFLVYIYDQSLENYI